MSYPTVEAIQVLLSGHGVILYPGSPDSPPDEILVEEIERGDFRVFDRHNSHGPLFVYNLNRALAQWERV